MLWYGYLHQNGSIQAKRFFEREDIEEAKDSPFVEKVYGPFEASGREDAIIILKKNFCYAERI